MLFQQNLEGTWTVKGDRIELGDLGYGVPVKLTLRPGELRDGFRFQFTRAPHDSRVLKVTTDVGHVLTYTGPKGLSIAQYCKFKP